MDNNTAQNGQHDLGVAGRVLHYDPRTENRDTMQQNYNIWRENTADAPEVAPNVFEAIRRHRGQERDIPTSVEFMIETFNLLHKRFLITEEQYRGITDLLKNEGITLVALDLLKSINKGDF